MSKSASLIVRPRHPHRKQIKKYYETQFLTELVLNDEIEKKKFNYSQLGLTNQELFPGHEVEIT
jgi:hypothetical protein